MSLKFFFNSDGAAIAFQKEQDFPDWENSVFDADAETNWTSDPASLTESGRTIDVSNIRRAVAIFKISGSDNYDFRVRFGANSQSSGMNVWYTPDGGTYQGITGNRYIGMDCLGVDYVSIVVDAVSGANTLSVEIAPVPYEESG